MWSATVRRLTGSTLTPVQFEECDGEDVSNGLGDTEEARTGRDGAVLVRDSLWEGSSTVDVSMLDAAAAVWTFDLDKEWDTLGYSVDGVGFAASLEGKGHFISDRQSSTDRVGIDHDYGAPVVVRPQSVEHYACRLEQFDRCSVDTRLDPSAVEEAGAYCLYAEEVFDLEGA